MNPDFRDGLLAGFMLGFSATLAGMVIVHWIGA